MIIDFDSHLREGYFMDEVYRLEGPYERFRPVKLNDGRTHNTKFLHSLDPISPQGHAAHRHPYIYDPKTNWRGGDIAARQVGGYDIARRREDIGKEGIDKQLICPTQITVATSNLGGLGRECARLFNDWVARLVKGHENIFLPVAMAPAGCPEAMADELRRCVKDLGFRTSHLVPYCGTRNLDDPSFYPYYQAAEELGVPLLCHPNSNGELVDRFDNFYKTHVLGRPTNCSAALVALVLGGVFEKFPGLKVVFFECSAEWILYWMHRMDDDWEWAKDFPQISGMLKMAPSEYIRRSCWVFSVLLALPAFGVEPTPGVAAVAAYSGPDRTARLIAGAKKEGELMLYSSLTQDDQLKLVADFKHRYGVAVKFWRGSQAHILQRVTSETRGGRFEFDVLETNSPQIEALAREKLLQKMNSPYIEQELLPEVIPSHGEWAPDRLNLLVYAYNTHLEKPADVPKSWQDLLDPKWKKRIGVESTNVEWFAALVKSLGEKAGLELFRRMADNGLAVRTGHNHSAVLVAAGEIPLMLGIYSHDADRMKAKSAPVDWFILPPAVVLPSAVAVSRRAPHPNAAALFYDYMLTDGQRFYTEVHHVPANKNYDTPVRRLVRERQAVKIVNAQETIDDYEKWVDLYKRIIVDRSQH